MTSLASAVDTGSGERAEIVQHSFPVPCRCGELVFFQYVYTAPDMICIMGLHHCPGWFASHGCRNLYSWDRLWELSPPRNASAPIRGATPDASTLAVPETPHGASEVQASALPVLGRDPTDAASSEWTPLTPLTPPTCWRQRATGTQYSRH